jgi:hypothetical protein
MVTWHKPPLESTKGMYNASAGAVCVAAILQFAPRVHLQMARASPPQSTPLSRSPISRRRARTRCTTSSSPPAGGPDHACPRSLEEERCREGVAQRAQGQAPARPPPRSLNAHRANRPAPSTLACVAGREQDRGGRGGSLDSDAEALGSSAEWRNVMAVESEEAAALARHRSARGRNPLLSIASVGAAHPYCGAVAALPCRCCSYDFKLRAEERGTAPGKKGAASGKS